MGIKDDISEIKQLIRDSNEKQDLTNREFFELHRKATAAQTSHAYESGVRDTEMRAKLNSIEANQVGQGSAHAQHLADHKEEEKSKKATFWSAIVALLLAAAGAAWEVAKSVFTDPPQRPH